MYSTSVQTVQYRVNPVQCPLPGSQPAAAARDRGQQTAAGLEELPLHTGSISLQPILDLSLQQKANEHTNQLVRSPLDLAGLGTGSRVQDVVEGRVTSDEVQW